MMRRWPLWLAAAWCALGLAGFTGSSYGYYLKSDPLLDPAARARPEVFGFARDIRSDEWAVDLPLGRVQQAASPSFPLVNRGLGLGHLQRNPFDSPVLDWGIAFRPDLWPLLAGSIWSQGVRWYLRSALLLLGLYGWLRALSDDENAQPATRARRAGVVAVAAIAISFSGSLNWFLSHAQTEIVAFMGLTVLAAWRARDARSRAGRVAWTGAVAYLSACTFFHFYAPVWAPALWLMCAAIADLHWRAQRHPGRALIRAIPAIAAVACGVLAALTYYAPYLSLIANTLYPGRRIASAGELSPGRLVEMLWPALQTSAPLTGHAGYRGKLGMNECEASCVEALPFFILGSLATMKGPVRDAVRRALKRAPATAIAFTVLAAWLMVPLPSVLGWITLLRWTPWFRAWMPFGLACAALATVMLAELAAAEPERHPRWREVVAGGALLVIGWFLARNRIVALDRRLIVTAALAAMLAIAASARVGARSAPTLLAAAWAAPLVLANGTVNPVMRSNALFARGSGHAVVDAALRERPGRIVDYTGAMGSVMAGFGWPVLNALQTAPDLDLFRFLAPESPGLTPDVYNRYAHVKPILPPGRSALAWSDAIEVELSPCSERLATLAVNHFLAPSGAKLPSACAAAFDTARAGDVVLWSRRDPVGEVGLARIAAPGSALDFDYDRRRVGDAARVRDRREGLTIEVAEGERRPVSLALNLALLERIRCDGARARLVDAHLIVTPGAAGGGRCDVAFVGSIGGLRRLLRPVAPVEISPAWIGGVAEAPRRGS